MSTSIRTVQGVLPDAAGDVDLTVSGETRTPVGAIVFANRADVLNANNNQAMLSIGYTDFTNVYCVTGNAEDGSGTTDAASQVRNDKIVSIDDEGAATPDKDATATAIAGGIRLSCNAGDASETFEVAAILIFGESAECHAFGLGTGTADGLTFDITHGLSGKPNFGFSSTTDTDIADAGGQAHFLYSFGVFSDDGTIVQAAVGHSVRSSQADGSASSYLNDSAFSMELQGTGPVENTQSVSANDATKTTITNSGGVNEDLVGLLVYAPDVTAAVNVIDSPTSSVADWNYNGLSFTPQFAMMIPSMLQAVDTSYTDDADAGAGGVMAFDEDGGEISCTWSDRNGVTPTEAYSRTDTKLYLNDHTGSAAFNMTNPAFTADGWDIAAGDITAADGTARKWIAFAVEAAAPPGEVINRVLTENTVITDPIPGYQLTQRRPSNSNINLLTDAAFLYYAYARLVIENFDVQDQYEIEKNLRSELADTVSVADAIQIIRTRFQEMSDAILSSDDFNKTITIGEEGSIYTKVRKDVLTVTDAINATFLGIVNEQLSDSVSVGEAAFLQRFRSYSLSDQMTLLSDLIGISRSYIRRMSDGVGAFDNVVATELKVRNVTMFDNFSLTDSFETQVTGIRRKRLTDILNLTDDRSSYQGSTLQPSVEIVTGLEVH